MVNTYFKYFDACSRICVFRNSRPVFKFNAAAAFQDSFQKFCFKKKSHCRITICKLLTLSPAGSRLAVVDTDNRLVVDSDFPEHGTSPTKTPTITENVFTKPGRVWITGVQGVYRKNLRFFLFQFASTIFVQIVIHHP